LNAKATKMVKPRYQHSARRKASAGLVRVHVSVYETGKVIAVSHTEGPMLLRAAAEEAARQWSFGGISSAGGPARFSGYIDFNFTL
jgi:TonB family protein